MSTFDPSEVQESWGPERDREGIEFTDLPDSFEESIDMMVAASQQILAEGGKRIQIDFDTSVGDKTYTALKQSLPMAKQYMALLSKQLAAGDGGNSAPIRVFFPDAGSAALARREWRVGKNQSAIPENIEFVAMNRESPRPGDQGCILLCPRHSETPEVLRLVKEVGETNQFIVMINPELVNMDITGYGLAGRRIRTEVLSTFRQAYFLRTLDWGAITKLYGRKYTIWQEDTTDPSGYKMIKTLDTKPSYQELEEIYDIANGLAEASEGLPKWLNGVADFTRAFGRM